MRVGFFGTNGYLPPEASLFIFFPTQVSALASDLFALGVTLLSIITYGQPAGLFASTQKLYAPYGDSKVYYDRYCCGDSLYKIHDILLEELVCSLLSFEPARRIIFWNGPRKSELIGALVAE